jgi:hypothetical protein
MRQAPRLGPKIDNMMQSGRTPQIQADAAYAIITSSSAGFTGNMCIDEQVLRKDVRLANILARD